MTKRILKLNVVRFAGMAAAGLALNANAESQLVWVGTYSTRGSEGIYSLRMDTQTGELTPAKLAAKVQSPSFLAVGPDRANVFAVCESGSPTGAVVSFVVDAKNGTLAERNRESSGGSGPCHLALDPPGVTLVVAHYGDGIVSVLPVYADGTLGPFKKFERVQHVGSGPNEKRQKSPHAHGVTFSTNGSFVFVPDLGIDRVKAYRTDMKNVRLEAAASADAKLAPGSGPRHFAFNPNETFAYSINELSNDITAFAWDANKVTMTPVATVSTLPAGFTNRNSTAEIVVHPNGKFLYGSNRGHNSIAVFALDEKTGAMTPVQHMATGGRTPRNFAIHPSGRFLLAANQETDNIVAFKLDPETGRLAETGFSVNVPSPVCVVFH